MTFGHLRNSTPENARSRFNASDGPTRRRPNEAERPTTEMMVSMITPQTPYPYDAPASQALLTRAAAVTPGGVNSPVRAFRAVGGTPRFMASANGPYLIDVDGREYVDLVCSWGPMILGHAHPDVLAAVQGAALKGCSFGTPSENEVALAEEIVARVAPVEQVRLVNSGTEATISSARATSFSLGVPKLNPLSAAPWTAASTSGCAWPRIIGPHEQTRSTYSRPSTSVR